MRYCNSRVEDVSLYGEFPEFQIKDNVDENGSIVCVLVPLTKEEKLEKAKCASSPELVSLATVPVEPISYGSRFAIMTQVSEAINQIPTIDDLKAELPDE